MRYTLFLLTFIIAFSSCSYQVKDLNCTGFEEIELFKKSGEGHLKGKLTFENSNTKSIQLQRADVEIFINQKSVGKIEEVLGEELEGKSPYEFFIDLSFNPDDVYPGFLATRLGSFGTTQVKVSAEGKIKSDLKGDKYDHEFEITESIVVKK